MNTGQKKANNYGNSRGSVGDYDRTGCGVRQQKDKGTALFCV